jgi:hypothetical protein
MAQAPSRADDSEGVRAETRLREFAWEPVTPRGVAAFSQATFGRLFLVELVIALLAAGVVVWCLATAWVPTVREAIHHLPEQGAIRNGELTSPRISREPLASGSYLTFVVATDDRADWAASSGLRLEFHKRNLQVCSLFGCAVMDYPKDWKVEFNRRELEPWWGAWEPILLGITAVVVVLGLLIGWGLRASVFCWVVRLIAFFNDRDLNVAGSWRLAAATAMPGALLLSAGILLYGLGALDLIHLLILAVLRLVLGWVYLIVCPLLLPRLPAGRGRSANPFAGPQPENKL